MEGRGSCRAGAPCENCGSAGAPPSRLPSTSDCSTGSAFPADHGFAGILLGDVADAVVVGVAGVGGAEEPVVPAAAGEQVDGVVVLGGVSRDRGRAIGGGIGAGPGVE